MKISEMLGKSVAELVEIYHGQYVLDDEDELDDEDLRYLEVRTKGICFVLNEAGQARTVFLYAKDTDSDYQPFTGAFLGDFKFSDSRATVRSRLGNPIEFRDPSADYGVLGRPVKPWDVYFIGEYRYHFAYTSEVDSIEMVTISVEI